MKINSNVIKYIQYAAKENGYDVANLKPELVISKHTGTHDGFWDFKFEIMKEGVTYIFEISTYCKLDNDLDINEMGFRESLDEMLKDFKYFIENKKDSLGKFETDEESEESLFWEQWTIDDDGNMMPIELSEGYIPMDNVVEDNYVFDNISVIHDGEKTKNIYTSIYEHGVFYWYE